MSAHWSDDVTKKFTLLWNSGVHWADIAVALNKEFGVTLTKGALLGRRKRLGLAARLAPPPREPRIPEGNSGPSALPTLESSPVHLLNAKSGRCRYPLWNDDGRTSVGELIVCGGDGYPYCAHHRALVYQRRKNAA